MEEGAGDDLFRREHALPVISPRAIIRVIIAPVKAVVRAIDVKPNLSS